MKRNNSTQLFLPFIAPVNNLPRVLSMGYIELNYILSLTDEDMEKFKINIESLSSIKDLGFLLENKYLWNNIQIRTNNFLLNTLLYVNKVSDNKVYIEYIPFELPTFDKQEKEIEKMIHDINDLNLLFISDIDLFPSKCSISLVIQHSGESKVFTLGKCTSDNKENKDSININSNTKSNNNKIVKNENSPLNKIRLSCKKYDYFIIDIKEASEIQPFDDFIEFITYLKVLCNSNIIIKFDNKINSFTDREGLIQLNKVYLLTDTFLINTNEAINSFNQHYQAFSTNTNSVHQIDEKNLNDYFITTIVCGGSLSLVTSKIGFILDNNLSKLTIIEVPNNVKPLITSYELKPYPKINHSNIELVENYKYVLKSNHDYFESIFYAGVLSKLFFSNHKIKGIDILYPGYLIGAEILKRILELEVKDYPYPSSQKFYVVKLNKSEINEYIKKFKLEKKEGKFVLDCINQEKSKMKYYVPLFDYNLHGYFKNELVRKELKAKGFINSKGFVNFDPVYRMEMYNKKMKLTRSNSKTAQDILREQLNKNDKLNKKRVLHSVPPTIKKLPIENCEVTSKIQKSKCRHKVKPGQANKKCNYCILSEKSKILEEIEKEKRKKMQLRRYDSN